MASPQDASRGNDAGLASVDMKLEVVVIPVADVERAKDFYTKLGWRQDVTPPDVFQFTPHGSPCSVQFGGNLTAAAPGSVQRKYLPGVEVGEIFHIGPDGPASGLDPERRTYRSQALF